MAETMCGFGQQKGPLGQIAFAGHGQHWVSLLFKDDLPLFELGRTGFIDKVEDDIVSAIEQTPIQRWPSEMMVELMIRNDVKSGARHHCFCRNYADFVNQIEPLLNQVAGSYCHSDNIGSKMGRKLVLSEKCLPGMST